MKIDEILEKYCKNGVRFYKLDEIVDFLNGKGHEKNIVENGRYIVVNSKFISTDGDTQKFSDEQICPVYKDDILMVMSDLPNGRALAKCFYVVEDDKYTLNQRICALRVKDKDLINTRFLYYYLNRNHQLLRYDNGVDQTNLRKDHILNIRVAVPPMKVQCEIVHILDDFTLLSAELSAELKARQKQYEYYLYKLISDSKKITKNKLYELTIWDKKFNAVENYMQPNVKKYPTLLAVELFNLERENGNVFLLSTGGQRGWTTEEVAGDNISEGEVVTIPWGKSRPVQEVMKYYCGKFVTGDNRIATSNDIKKLNNKYLFYWMQTQSERIDKFYRGSGIQHPNMRNVLTLEIELPSIDEQKRIVSILDKFEKLCNDISQGLPAEIEVRQKQYEYYRDKLLTFKELKVNE